MQKMTLKQLAAGCAVLAGSVAEQLQQLHDIPAQSQVETDDDLKKRRTSLAMNILDEIADMRRRLRIFEDEAMNGIPVPSPSASPYEINASSVAAYARTHGFKMHREPGHCILVFDDTFINSPVKQYADNPDGYGEALRWMERYSGDNDIPLLNFTVKERDIQTLAFVPDGQGAITYQLYEGEHEAPASGVLYPRDRGYRELFLLISARQHGPATLHDIEAYLRSHVYHIDMEIVEYYLSQKGSGYSLVSDDREESYPDFSRVVAGLLNALGSFQEKPE